MRSDPQQAVEKSRQLRSRVAQSLHVPQGYAFDSSLAAALLDGLFEQPTGSIDALRDLLQPPESTND